MAVMVLALVMFAAVVQEAKAQIISQEVSLFAGKRLANSAKDSVVGFTITYNGYTYKSLRGVTPDSIVFVWSCGSDSLVRVFERFKARARGTSTYTSILFDSCKTTSAAVGIGMRSVASVNWLGYDQFGLSLNAQATGNATLTANASRLYVRALKYFHLP